MNIYFSALSDLKQKILLQPIVWSSAEILTFTEIFFKQPGMLLFYMFRL